MVEVPESVDYIIVGGGPAGCTVASRIHQFNTSLTVLLIEAGPDPTGHPLVTKPLDCFPARHSDIDWDYKTVPQKHLNDRITYAGGGKVLSGGTAINYGSWTRGPAVDWDHWGKVVGDPAWSYDGLLPYFKRTETHFGHGDPANHGHDGPIHVIPIAASDPKRKYPLREPFRNAWNRIGVKYIEDGNSGDPLGLTETVEAWRDGKRQLASKARDLSGVQVLTDTLVRRVIIEDQQGKKTATGVELADGRSILARKEVIISAGAYRTPQVLMLSGIGPAEELSRVGIPLVLDLPEVGRNFYDHMHNFTFWRLRHPEQGLAIGTPLWTDPAYYKGFPADWIITEHVPDEEIRAALKVDGDVQDQHGLLDPRCGHTESIPLYAPGDAATAGVEIPVDGTCISCITIGMLPTSRGTVTISSNDPSSPPVIDPNFYATEVDRAAMRAGLRQVMRLFQETPEGREAILEEVPPPGYKKLTARSTDEEFDERNRRIGSSTSHPAGTAAMGKVVDTELKVKGIEGLRVVDASIFPVNIGAHFQLPVYTIAEKAADLITKGK